MISKLQLIIRDLKVKIDILPLQKIYELNVPHQMFFFYLFITEAG